MSNDSLTLIQAVQQVGDEALLRALAEVARANLMAFEVEGWVGAANGSPSAERHPDRQGYRERPLHTRLGTLEGRIPKRRQGTSFPLCLEPRRLRERALTAVVQEAWVGGMSTRKVDDLVQAWGMSGLSKSQVSELCGALDERVNDFLERPLTGEYRYRWLDGTSRKVRQGGRVVSVAALLATGVHADGHREVLGLVLNATWQRGRVPWMRTLLVCVPKAPPGMVAAALRQVFTQPTPATAQALWRPGADQLRARFAQVAARMDEAQDDVLAYLAFPDQHRVKLYSTHGLERLNKEVKRRANVVGIFPNEACIRRLIGAILAEPNDEWLLQNRSMTWESLTVPGRGLAEVVHPALPAVA